MSEKQTAYFPYNCVVNQDQLNRAVQELECKLGDLRYELEQRLEQLEAHARRQVDVEQTWDSPYMISDSFRE